MASAANDLPVPGAPWNRHVRPCCSVEPKPHCPNSTDLHTQSHITRYVTLTHLAFSYCTISISDLLSLSVTMILSSPLEGTTRWWKSFILSMPLSCRLAPWRRSFCDTVGLSPSRDTAMDRADSMAFFMKPPVSSNLNASSF